jgi:hypothetical protein
MIHHENHSNDAIGNTIHEKLESQVIFLLGNSSEEEDAPYVSRSHSCSSVQVIEIDSDNDSLDKAKPYIEKEDIHNVIDLDIIVPNPRINIPYTTSSVELLRLPSTEKTEAVISENYPHSEQKNSISSDIFIRLRLFPSRRLCCSCVFDTRVTTVGVTVGSHLPFTFLSYTRRVPLDCFLKTTLTF